MGAQDDEISKHVRHIILVGDKSRNKMASIWLTFVSKNQSGSSTGAPVTTNTQRIFEHATV